MVDLCRTVSVKEQGTSLCPSVSDGVPGSYHLTCHLSFTQLGSGLQCYGHMRRSGSRLNSFVEELCSVIKSNFDGQYF